MSKFLKAEKQNTQYYFQVTLDETKVQADGTPDPNFVREFVFPVFPPDGETNNDYLNQLKSDLAALIRYENTKLAMSQNTVPQDLLSFFA